MNVNTFVGLKNLGATCYINSLLQLWFHNTNIRNAILNWDPKEDEYEKVNLTLNNDKSYYEPMTIIGHLQLIFAKMHLGNQKTVDPQPFVKSLSIDVNVQGDPEEFQKILVTMFEDKLNSQSNVSVREMIKNNFFGESNNVTICLKCKTESVTTSRFMEIDLNITCYNTVTENLQAYFKKQELTGKNQYYCEKCHSLQNAVCQTVLTSLPNLIHLKLMRYVYDNYLKTTIKLHNVITCPYTIDMGKYFDVSYESSNSEHVYSLCGVLIHKGGNANFGHYTTHIKDFITEQWYELDDENVEMLNTNDNNDSNLPDEYIFEELAPNKSINIYNTNEYKTNNAYLLVYIKRTSLVMKLNTESNEVKKDEGEAISDDWLISLVETKPPEEVFEILHKSIVCPHKKLNQTNAIHLTKYIGTKLADKLYELYTEAPRLKLNSSLCDLCVRNTSAFLCMGKLTKDDKQLISEIQFDSINNSNIDDKNNGQTFWLGIESAQCWQIKYMKMFDNFLKLHKILPDEPLPINKESLVAFCKPLIGILDNTLVNVSIEENNIETDDDTDGISFDPNYNISLYEFTEDIMNDYFENLEIERTRIMFNYDEDVNNHIDNIFLIENSEHVPWTLNDDITCPHGNLCIAEETMILVPQAVKTILQCYFPKVELFAKNTKPCYKCKAYYKNVYNPRMINFMSGVAQQRHLISLICDDTRPESTEENRPYFCIPKDFLESWQRFVAEPREEPKPIMINNKSLLCQDHNELLFEPTSNFVATDQSVSVIITKKEWMNLLDFYRADCGVFAYFDNNGIFQKSIPKVCGICNTTLGNVRKFEDYIDKPIYIQVNSNNFKCYDTDSKFEGNSVKKFKMQDASTNYAGEYEAAAVSSINIYNSTSDYGTRRIGRQTPQSQSITMSSNDTVFLLKNKIEKVFNVSPANQILETASGKPLIENEAKLRDLQIYPESVIIAKFIDANLTKNVAVEGTEFKGSPHMN